MKIFSRQKNTSNENNVIVNAVKQDIQEENEIDYMHYFFEGRTKNNKLEEIICKNLDVYSPEEIKNIANYVLSISINLLKEMSVLNAPYSERTYSKYINPSFSKYHIAVTWHLTDSIHNIPSEINGPESSIKGKYGLSGSISGFFVFIYLLKNLETQFPIGCHNLQYAGSEIYKKWQHLYRER